MSVQLLLLSQAYRLQASLAAMWHEALDEKVRGYDYRIYRAYQNSITRLQRRMKKYL